MRNYHSCPELRRAFNTIFFGISTLHRNTHPRSRYSIWNFLYNISPLKQGLSFAFFCPPTPYSPLAPMVCSLALHLSLFFLTWVDTHTPVCSIYPFVHSLTRHWFTTFCTTLWSTVFQKTPKKIPLHGRIPCVIDGTRNAVQSSSIQIVEMDSSVQRKEPTFPIILHVMIEPTFELVDSGTNHTEVHMRNAVPSSRATDFLPALVKTEYGLFWILYVMRISCTTKQRHENRFNSCRHLYPITHTYTSRYYSVGLPFLQNAWFCSIQVPA